MATTDHSAVATKPLTGKQRAFCREYIMDWNAYQAALRAGYAESTAKVDSHRFLENPRIAKEIRRLEDERAEALQTLSLIHI